MHAKMNTSSSLAEIETEVPTALDMSDAALVTQWCDRYDVTPEFLANATAMVGLMPAALHFYLTSRGRPTKRVTDEMRASRAPIPPRDRRRKAVAGGESTLDQLARERAMLESDLRMAADGLHAHLCPATIHAYDEAQKRLDATIVKLEAAQPPTPVHGATARGFTLKDGAP